MFREVFDDDVSSDILTSVSEIHRISTEEGFNVGNKNVITILSCEIVMAV